MKVGQRVRKEQEKEQRRHSLPKGRKNKEQNVSSSYNSQKRKKKKLFSEGLKDNIFATDKKVRKNSDEMQLMREWRNDQFINATFTKRLSLSIHANEICSQKSFDGKCNTK